MTAEQIRYPFSLNRQEIEEFIPHRGEIFSCRTLDILGPHDFTGVASWPRSNVVLQGHFPDMPVVPGVMLIEATAQLAGAGLLSGDPYSRSLAGTNIGVLAAVRKCSFARPVLPDELVSFSIHCRQMGAMAVQVTASASVNGVEIAQLDILMAYANQDQLRAAQQAKS